MKIPANLSAAESTKKPYRRPQLKVYGDLQNITQALAGMNGNDNSGLGNSKSSQ